MIRTVKNIINILVKLLNNKVIDKISKTKGFYLYRCKIEKIYRSKTTGLKNIQSKKVLNEKKYTVEKRT